MTVKIDWAGLIKQSESDQEPAENIENEAKSRENPDFFYADSEKSGKLESSNDKGFRESSRLYRLSRPKNEGGGIIPAPEMGQHENFCAAYPLHSIAVCLLFAVTRKIDSTNDEISHELFKLETIPPTDQVKTWARYAVENGIDPHQIICPFTKSPGAGHDCMSCQHLDMTSTSQPGISRKVYQWQCKKQHQILEACYLRERLLIAPVECTDYKHV